MKSIPNFITFSLIMVGVILAVLWFEDNCGKAILWTEIFLSKTMERRRDEKRLKFLILILGDSDGGDPRNKFRLERDELIQKLGKTPNLSRRDLNEFD